MIEATQMRQKITSVNSVQTNTIFEPVLLPVAYLEF